MNISENVRRQILDNLIILGECFGTNGRAVDFVNRVAPYYKNISDLERHMDRFKDWTLDQLFYDELGLLYVGHAEQSYVSNSFDTSKTTEFGIYGIAMTCQGII